MCTVVIVSTTGTDQENTMTTQTIRHEVEVDTEIAAAHGAFAKDTEYLVSAMKSGVRRTHITGLANYTNINAVYTVIDACAASTCSTATRLADDIVERDDQYVTPREAF